MSVHEAQSRIDSREFQEWRAYSLVEHGFGPPADYWRFAMLASTMANMWRSEKGQALSIEDFMPSTPVAQSPDERQAAHQERMDAAMAALGGGQRPPKRQAS